MSVSIKSVMLYIVLLLFSTIPVQSWYTCNNVDFCSRLRNSKPTEKYTVDSKKLDITLNDISTHIVNGRTGKQFSLELTALNGGDIYRVVIDDRENPRHRVEDALNIDNLVKTSTKIKENNSVGQTISLITTTSKAIIQANPFKIDFYYNDVLISTVNTDGLLTIEDNEPEVAVGIDVLFPGAKNAYGLPSHSEGLSLRDTVHSEPYRLYNIHRSSYGYHEKQALYGTVPVLYAHSEERAAGFFWLNSAQTFVDLEKTASGVKTFFMSESGALEFFILAGPTLKDAVKQYASITGKEIFSILIYYSDK